MARHALTGRAILPLIGCGAYSVAALPVAAAKMEVASGLKVTFTAGPNGDDADDLEAVVLPSESPSTSLAPLDGVAEVMGLGAVSGLVLPVAAVVVAWGSAAMIPVVELMRNSLLQHVSG